LTPFDLLPPSSFDQLRTEPTELPLPGDLKAQQKEQITRLFEQVDTVQLKERRNNRA
jgi:hypothetical protein